MTNTTDRQPSTAANWRHQAGSLDGRPPAARAMPPTTRETRCCSDGSAVTTGAPVTTSWAASLWVLCGHAMSGPHSQQLQRDPDDERGNHDDEDRPHEPAAEPDRRAGAHVAAEEVAHRHDQPDLDHDVAARGEDDQGTEVGRDVGDLRLRAGLEERVAHEAHQGEDEERTGSRSQRAVVDADDEADGHRGV